MPLPALVVGGRLNSVPTPPLTASSPGEPRGSEQHEHSKAGVLLQSTRSDDEKCNSMISAGGGGADTRLSGGGSGLCADDNNFLFGELVALRSQVFSLNQDMGMVKESQQTASSACEQLATDIARLERESREFRRGAASLETSMPAKLESAIATDKSRHHGLKHVIPMMQRICEERFAEFGSKLRELSMQVQEDRDVSLAKVDQKLLLIHAQKIDETDELKGLLQAEVRALSPKLEGHALELHRLFRSLERSIDEARVAKDQLHDKCIGHADGHRAALQRDISMLQERQNHLDRALTEQAQEMRRYAAAAAAESRRHAEDLHATLQARTDETFALSAELQAELRDSSRDTHRRTEEALAASRGAIRLVDERFEEIMCKGSRSLAAQIEAVAEKAAAQTGHAAEHFEAGFYGLIARRTLDVEMQTLMDRAIRRLQQVSDDLAWRSGALQDQAAVARRQMQPDSRARVS